jgi:hypothetical protein
MTFSAVTERATSEGDIKCDPVEVEGCDHRPRGETDNAIVEPKKGIDLNLGTNLAIDSARATKVIASAASLLPDGIRQTWRSAPTKEV